MRVHNSAERVAGLVDFFDLLSRAGNDSAKQVGVSAEVFGPGVHDQINAELDGALIDGRGESTVNHGQNAGLFYPAR